MDDLSKTVSSQEHELQKNEMEVQVNSYLTAEYLGRRCRFCGYLHGKTAMAKFFIQI